MVKSTRMLASFFIICLSIAICGVNVFAFGSNLPESFFIDDENGISVGSTGEYFMYSDRVIPGDIITRNLTLRNLQQDEPFKLHMLGKSPKTKGPVDWLDNLHLQITLDGREIYAGRLRGDGKDTRTMKGNGVDLLYTGIDLGLYKPGAYKSLVFVIIADAGHLATKDFYKVSEAKITWVFNAVKDTGPQDGPKTGEIVRYGLYIFLFLIIVICTIFYYRYRRLRESC